MMTDNKGVTTYKRRRSSTFTTGLRELLQWLLDNNCRDVCMESTGKYWIPVYNVLETECKVVLAHPKYVKAIKGKKTDKKDAKWIADLFKDDLLEGSFMPPKDIRDLRDLMRYRYKLTCFSSSEKNRLQNSLTVSNIQLAKPHQFYIDLILSMPSIKDPFTAITIISEIGVDMSKFPTTKNLCSWAGLTPTNNESAGKKKSVRISYPFFNAIHFFTCKNSTQFSFLAAFFQFGVNRPSCSQGEVHHNERN